MNTEPKTSTKVISFIVATCIALYILFPFYLLFSRVVFGRSSDEEQLKTLLITVPEDLEYAELFDDIFDRYTESAKLVRVKTTNLGSLNRLTYDIRLRKCGEEKAMIDALRCRNGNLEINLASRASSEGL